MQSRHVLLLAADVAKNEHACVCVRSCCQVSNYLSFNKEDSDAEKKGEMAGVVSIGETVYVKVGHMWLQDTCLPRA